MISLTESDVVDHVHGICFKTGPPGRVGVESEWLVADMAQPYEPVPMSRLEMAIAAAGPLPAGSTVTYEPGGQLELSSLPQPGAVAAYQALIIDLSHIEKPLAKHGLELTAHGLEPYRAPTRQLTHQRYEAMEAYFESAAGEAMMCSTASVQVCLDIGRDPDDAAIRWRLAHRIGPVLVAAFANSPLWRGRSTGWRSTRQKIWSALDASRTRPARNGGDPVTDWAEYALNANVMAIRQDHKEPWIVGPGLRFRDWIRTGRPTLDDLDFHLSTLFPPVRPRGWLELRMIDASPHWPVAVAVAAALIDDPIAASIAYQVTEEFNEAIWLAAARAGPADPIINRAALACFGAARDALPRLGADALAPLVDAYIDRYVEPGRCPADDLLEGR